MQKERLFTDREGEDSPGRFARQIPLDQDRIVVSMLHHSAAAGEVGESRDKLFPRRRALKPNDDWWFAVDAGRLKIFVQPESGAADVQTLHDVDRVEVQGWLPHLRQTR